MGDFYLPLVFMLLVLAALLRENFVFTLLYLLVSAYALGVWWSRKALQSVRIRRFLPTHVFLEEDIRVQIEVSNSGLLPVVWLRLHEALPVELAVPNFLTQVASLAPRETMRFDYHLKPRKRGYYPIGPLSIYSGDILGLANQAKREGSADYLTVYPKIVRLARVEVPSRFPMGALRHHQPIFEDPARVIGKRDYVAGDSLRRIDWKTTAITGCLQVKHYEPSIVLETAIFLNLNTQDYVPKTRFSATELAIVAAASIANWIVSKKQAVGLVTNGIDPLSPKGRTAPLTPRKGRSHLMRVLEVLARVQIAEIESLVDMLRSEILHLTWGTTLILITGNVDEATFETLFLSRHAGLNTMLVLCGSVTGYREIQRQADYFKFPIYHLFSEQDLDVWR